MINLFHVAVRILVSKICKVKFKGKMLKQEQGKQLNIRVFRLKSIKYEAQTECNVFLIKLL